MRELLYLCEKYLKIADLSVGQQVVESDNLILFKEHY